MSSFLRFTNSPVSPEAIAAAIAEKAAQAEKELAAKVAVDMAACQAAVDSGLKTLRQMRRALREFEKNFKALESAESVPKFAEMWNMSPVRSHTGHPAIQLTADYDTEE